MGGAVVCSVPAEGHRRKVEIFLCRCPDVLVVQYKNENFLIRRT
jgi:hypothetical protein